MKTALKASALLLLLLGLLAVGYGQANQILDCYRTTEDIGWNSAQYNVLYGIKLSNHNLEVTHVGSGGETPEGRVLDGITLTPVAPEFDLPYTTILSVAGVNGDFAVVYSTGDSLYLQPYTSSGQPTGSPIYIANSPNFNSMIAVQLSDPNLFALVWRDGNGLFGRTFTKWNTVSSVFTITLSPLSKFEGVGLSTDSNRFVVSWLLNTKVLQFRVFDPSGAPVSAEKTVASQVSDFDSTALKNAGGKFAIAWASSRDLTNTMDGGYVYGQIFSKAGDATTTTFSIRTMFNEQYIDYNGQPQYVNVGAIKLVAFSKGRFIVLFITSYPNVSYLYGRNYDSAGTALDNSERIIMTEIVQFKSISLKSDAWVIVAEYGRELQQFSRGIIMKSFASFYDYIGIESYPVNYTAFVSYKGLSTISATNLIEVKGDYQQSRLAIIWTDSWMFHREEYVFGMKCVLRESQCYNDFQALTNEKVASITTQHDQRYPSISRFSLSSNQVIVYQSDAAAYGRFDILARFNDGPEIQLNSVNGGIHTNPAVAMFNREGFLAVWQSLNQDGSGWGIYGSQYGNAEFRINDYIASNQINPAVACSPNTVGNHWCVVVWQSLNQDGSGYGVYAKLFSDYYAGGPEFRVNTVTANNQQNPKVAFLADGVHFVITWQHMTDGDGWGIRYKMASIFDNSYLAQPPYVLPGPDLKANQIIAGNQMQPTISSYLTVNQFVIAWKSQLGTTTVVARLFDMNSPISNDFVVSSVSGTQLGYPAVTSFWVGWAVAWQGDNGVFLKTYNGTAEMNFKQVNSSPVGNQPAAPSIAGGAYNTSLVVTWESSQIDGSGYGVGIRYFGCTV